MTFPSANGPFRKHRVAVPLDIQTAILALGTERRACEVLGIGWSTYRDVVSVNGMVSSAVLARVRAALDKVSAQDARV